MNILYPRRADAAGARPQGMTKAAIEGIFEEVEKDPLAGMGELSKRALVIDKLIAHWNIMLGKAAPAPVIDPELEIPGGRTVDLK